MPQATTARPDSAPTGHCDLPIVGGGPAGAAVATLLDRLGVHEQLAAIAMPIRKHRKRRHDSAALFGHFSGAQRQAGRLARNIGIFRFAHGWFWFIPPAAFQAVFQAVFKAVCCAGSPAALPRTARAWRERRRDMRDLGALPGKGVAVPGP